MDEYRAPDGLYLVGHSWCLHRETGRAFRGNRHSISPARTTKTQVEISPYELEGLELGLNAAERMVYVRLREEGKTVLRAGWPDLLVVDGDEIYGIEVKRQTHRVSERQQEMHAVLGRAGLRVDVVRVRGGVVVGLAEPSA